MTFTQQPTVGQMERELSQKLQALYRSRLGQNPSKATCQIFDAKVAIVLEDSVTQPEQLLLEEGQQALAEQVRADLDQAMRPQIKQVIEEILKVKVIDLLSDAILDTKRTGIIAILDEPPLVRRAQRSSSSTNGSGEK